MIKSYVVHIRSLKQALNRELILKKVHRAIQLNQEEACMNKNTELKAKAENDFERDFFNLMNNSAFEAQRYKISNNR